MNQALRRRLTLGVISGLTVAFFILIGVPSGTSDAEGLPGWFVWALLMGSTAVFAYAVSRPRNPAEARAQTLPRQLNGGLIMGIATASIAVALMCGLNAFQLWEIQQPQGGVPLASGLPNKISRVQDVFENVTPRTTAIMSGLSYTDIRTPEGTPRADPTIRFFLFSILYVLAGVAGAALNWAVRMGQAGRGGVVAARPTGGLRSWAPMAIPLLLLGFIVLNAVLPSATPFYRNLIGDNAQLAGLLASFLLVAAGLLVVRSAAGSEERGDIAQRLLLTLPISLLLIVVALAAPARPPNDLLYSPRPPNTLQLADGSIVIDEIPPLPVDTLLLYRTVTILAIGVIFVAGNIIGARGKLPLRTLVALNLLLSAIIVAPLYLDKYQQSVLLLVGINILLGLGLNIVIGYAGLLDLGYVAFFAIGAYAYAFLSSNQDIRKNGQIIALKFAGNDQMVQSLAAALFFGVLITGLIVAVGLRVIRNANTNRAAVRTGSARSTSVPGWAGPVLVVLSVAVTLLVTNALSGTAFYASFSEFPAFIIGAILGVMFAAFAGVMLGIPVLRLRGDYLAIVTLGFGEIIRLFLNNVKDVTGGPAGLLSIPRLTVGNVEIGSNEGLLYLVIAGCILIALLSLRLRSSRLGRAWGALKSDEDIAQAMGINLVNTKVLAFAIGAGFAGLGGVIFAARQGNIFPDNFTLQVSINILALVIIGGMGSVPGVIVGALVLIGIPESLRVFEAYRILAFGALLVAMMLLRPGGLLPQPPQPLENRARALRGDGPPVPERPSP